MSRQAAGRQPARKHRLSIHGARTACLTIVFVSIVAGLILRAGWGTLSSLGLGAVATICPLGALETLVAGHTPLPRTLISLLCMLVLAALFGRAFCAWVCPVPPIRRFFHPGANARKKAAGGQDGSGKPGPTDPQAAAMQPQAENCAACGGGCKLDPVGGARDGLQLDSRHGALLGALVGSAVCGFPVFCLVCPIGLTFALVVSLYCAFFEQTPTISLLVFAVILLLELAFFRKWCHKVCPLGALLSLVGCKAPLGKPRVDTARCLRSAGHDCRACVESCPEQLDPHSKSIPECTRCGACAEACPAQAIRMAPTRGKLRKRGRSRG